MELYKHQKDALKRTYNFNKCAFYHDMGLGKTFTGSEKLNQLGNFKNLIVCQKSKIDDWTKHFKKHYKDYEVFDLTNKKDYANFEIIYKSYTNKYVAVVNYDLVFRRDTLKKVSNFTLLLDESSLIQNDKAKRTKAILNLKFDNVILLSGTPCGGKYENLYSQLKLLGMTLTKKAYWQSYINYELVQYGGNTRLIPKVTGYKNIENLKSKMRLFGADFLKTDDVFSLPDQNFNIINIPCNARYKKFKKEKCLIFNHNEQLYEFIGDNPLKYMLYLRQLCGAFNYEKLDALKDLIDSTRDRLIIFYNFTNELEEIKNVVGDRPLSIVNGVQRDLTNYEKYDNSIVLIQYQAGAMGLNLQLCNKIIYFTLPLSSELFEQSKKRTHRIGQELPCFYYILMCNGIEERIYKQLEIKKDYTNKLFENDFM